MSLISSASTSFTIRCCRIVGTEVHGVSRCRNKNGVEILTPAEVLVGYADGIERPAASCRSGMRYSLIRHPPGRGMSRRTRHVLYGNLATSKAMFQFPDDRLLAVR